MVKSEKLMTKTQYLYHISVTYKSLFDIIYTTKKDKDLKMTYDINQIDDYQNRLNNEQKEIVISHCNEFQIEPVICAWYEDMDDFYDAWEEVGYSTEEADALFNDSNDEFLAFDNETIVRFVK